VLDKLVLEHVKHKSVFKPPKKSEDYTTRPKILVRYVPIANITFCYGDMADIGCFAGVLSTCKGLQCGLGRKNLPTTEACCGNGLAEEPTRLYYNDGAEDLVGFVHLGSVASGRG